MTHDALLMVLCIRVRASEKATIHYKPATAVSHCSHLYLKHFFVEKNLQHLLNCERFIILSRFSILNPLSFKLIEIETNNISH